MSPAPLQHHGAERPLGLIGLSVSALLLMGFHQVVSGALQQAQSQRALHQQLVQAEASCLDLADAPQRQLCILRLETARPEQLAAAR